VTSVPDQFLENWVVTSDLGIDFISNVTHPQRLCSQKDADL